MTQTKQLSPAQSENALKRKRTNVQELPKKRAKSDNRDEGAEEDIVLAEQAILESKKNYNRIKDLISIAKQEEYGQADATSATVSLCRIFVQLIAAGRLTMREGLQNRDAVVVQWLNDRLAEYEKILLQMLERENQATTALTLCMRLLKFQGQHLTGLEEYSFPKPFLTRVVSVLLYSNMGDHAMQELVEKYVEEYQDVRFFTFKAVEYASHCLACLIGMMKNLTASRSAILTQGGEIEDTSTLFEKAFSMLYNMDKVPGPKEQFKNFYMKPPNDKKHEVLSPSKLKKSAQGAWLALMRLASTKYEKKLLLDCMSREIAPWFVNPERLSDFLTDCYHAGGSMSLLALSGVFYLIQERNLEYPSFYPKLYSLLDAEILHSRYRSKFLRQLEVFLASSHLPAALVASFIKRLSRLALNAPPGAIVVIVPFLYNLFKSHPQTTFLMHRVIRDAEMQVSVQKEGFKDPFDPDEADPMETGAIDSCIWEIVQLQSHYHPNVATIARIVSEQFTKPSYNMEDFLDHSYHSVSLPNFFFFFFFFLFCSLCALQKVKVVSI